MSQVKDTLENQKKEILILLNKNDSVRVTAELLGVSKNVLYRFLNENGYRRNVNWSKK